jgi:hypothetical protein
MITPLNTVTMPTGVLFFLAFLLFLFKMRENRNVQFLGIVLMIYTLGYLVMPRLEIFEMDRYFSIITPLVYLFIVMMIQEKTQSVKPAYRIIIYCIVFVWSSYPIIRSVVNIQAWHERSCSATDASK